MRNPCFLASAEEMLIYIYIYINNRTLMTLIVQIIADCFICGHPVFLRHLRSVFIFKTASHQRIIK